MIAIGIAVFGLVIVQFAVPLPRSVIDLTPVSFFPFVWGGYQLRNSYADDRGEAPQFRTPRYRRLWATILFAIGLVALSGPLIFRS